MENAKLVNEQTFQQVSLWKHLKRGAIKSTVNKENFELHVNKTVHFCQIAGADGVIGRANRSRGRAYKLEPTRNEKFPPNKSEPPKMFRISGTKRENLPHRG